MLTTVADYCQKRGVSRQFVYAYIKSGKFKRVELPVFVEYKGQKIECGVQPFIDVEDIPTKEMPYSLIDVAHPKLRAFYKKYFALKNKKEKADFKTKMYAEIETLPADEKNEIYEAMADVDKKMMIYMKELEAEMLEILKK